MTVRRTDDPNDEALVHYRNVPDRELLIQRGLFVAEGRLVVERLLGDRRHAVRSVLVTPAACASIRGALDARPDVDVLVVDQQIMNGIVGFNMHRGCLALAERPPLPAWQDVAHGARSLVVLERVGNVDNVGAIFRNAAAMGVEGVLLGPACADPLYRKAVRTSMGAVLTVPFAPMAPWPDALGDLAAAGWLTIALTPHPAATPLREVAGMARGKPWALVVGHEGDGLTPASMQHVGQRARIPMAPGIDSLNVATSAAVALYELNRE
jgi:tRNA G18 (ribose-2'-O)-methylase SpoU